MILSAVCVFRILYTARQVADNSNQKHSEMAIFMLPLAATLIKAIVQSLAGCNCSSSVDIHFVTVVSAILGQHTPYCLPIADLFFSDVNQ